MWRVYKNLCPAKINASIMAANIWKNSLKKVESDNKILYENLFDFFLQRNGAYFLNTNNSKACFYMSFPECFVSLIIFVFFTMTHTPPSAMCSSLSMIRDCILIYLTW